MPKAEWETLAKEGFAAFFDDVRHKLVEEAWFGRATTGDNAHGPSLSEGLGWALKGKEAPASPDIELANAHTHKVGIDR